MMAEKLDLITVSNFPPRLMAVHSLSQALYHRCLHEQHGPGRQLRGLAAWQALFGLGYSVTVHTK